MSYVKGTPENGTAKRIIVEQFADYTEVVITIAGNIPSAYVAELLWSASNHAKGGELEAVHIRKHGDDSPATDAYESMAVTVATWRSQFKNEGGEGVRFAPLLESELQLMRQAIEALHEAHAAPQTEPSVLDMPSEKAILALTQAINKLNRTMTKEQ